MVDLKSQYEKIREDVNAGIQEVIDTTTFIKGGKVNEFQKNLEAYLGVKHVIPTGNGTDALQIALMALGLKPGDEVITPTFTFIATAEVVALLGLTPVVVDVEEDTFNMDIEAVKRAIRNYDWRSLDKYKAKVNFFSMSWKQDEMDANSQEVFSMRAWMRGNRIRFSEELDETSNSNEAYLRTWGWSTYVPVWYLYFRKINFPLDPDIHGTWEWAGIYMGNKL